ncbi:GAF domain-containing protein [Candidatus Leptofilum sp.]|uniref:GAF domain-containing protein n=1 Tax=Candidatus Leptofilum sp. TaxID=3241576 RepID=UPI003B5CB23D
MFVAIILLNTVFVASEVLSGEQRRRALIFGAFFALITGLVGLLPLPFRISAQIELYVPGAIIGILAIALVFSIVRGYGQYSLNIKLLAGFLFIAAIVSATVLISSRITTRQFTENALPSEQFFGQISAQSRIVQAEAFEFVSSGEEETLVELTESTQALTVLTEQLSALEVEPTIATAFSTLAEDAGEMAALAQNLVQSHEETLEALEALEEAEEELEALFEEAQAVIGEEIDRNVAAGDIEELEEDAIPALASLSAFVSGAQILQVETLEFVATGEAEAIAEFEEVREGQAAAQAALLATLESDEPGEAGLAEQFADLEGVIETTALAVLESHGQTLELLEAFEETEETLNDSLISAEQLINQLVDDTLAAENLRFILTVIASLGGSIALGSLIANTISRPVSQLATATQRLADGDLSAAAEVTSGDEIGQLGNAFNRMRDRIQTMLGDLEERSVTITTSAKISRQLSTILDPKQLATAVVQELQSTFNYYHAHIYFVDEAGQNLVMVGGTGEAGQKMLAQGHKIPMGKGLVGQTAVANQPVLVPDVYKAAGWLPNPLLPETKAEATIPISLGDKVLGILDVQQNTVNGLGEADVELLTSIANQVAIGLQNATLFAERDKALATIQDEQARVLAILQSIAVPIVISNISDGIVQYVNDPLTEVIRAPREELIGEVTPDFYANPDDRAPFLEAIRQNGFVHNYELHLKRADDDLFWALVSAQIINYRGTPALITSLIDIDERKQGEALLARQTAELTKQTNELAAVAQVSTLTANILDPQELLQQVVDLTKSSFDLYHTHIHLLDDLGRTLVLTAGAGDVGRQMVSEGREIPLAAEGSLVATVARTRQGAIRTYETPEQGFMPHPLLTETRSEMAVPIAVGEQVLGVLDVRSDKTNAFGQTDLQTVATLASQVAVALQNARSFAQSTQAVQELQELSRRLTREGWSSYLAEKSDALNFSYEDARDTVETAVPTKLLTHPLQIQGEAIGQLKLEMPDQVDKELSELVTAVADRLTTHLENIRLAEQSEQALAQTESLYAGSQRIVRATKLQDVLDALISSTELHRLDSVALMYFDKPEGEYAQTLTIKALWHADKNTQADPVGTIYPAQLFNKLLKAQTREIAFIENVHTDSRIDPAGREFFEEKNIFGFVYLPIIVGDQWLGLITGQSYTPLQLSEDAIRQISGLKDQASLVSQSLLQYEEAQTRAHEEQLLREVTTRINQAVDAESVLRVAAEEIGRVLGLEGEIVLDGVGRAKAVKRSTNGSRH